MKKIFFFAAVAAVTLLTACDGGQTKADLKTDVDTLSYEMGMANTMGVENYFAQMGIDSTQYNEFLRGMRDGALAGDDKSKNAYFLGLQAGQQMRMQMIPSMEQRIFAGDSTAHLNMKDFLAGFAAGIKKQGAFEINGKQVEPQTASEEINARMQAIADRHLEKRFANEKQAAADWMKKMAATEGVKALSNGVYYKELTAGTGAKPDSMSTVQIEYEGRLMNDSVFDSSIQRQPGKPVDMNVGGVIAGMRTALLNMPVGSDWEIYIPYDQAYGAMPQGPFPAYSNLKFRVKLTGIKEKQ